MSAATERAHTLRIADCDNGRATGAFRMPDGDDRLEREINEILNKIEQFPTPETRRNRALRRQLRHIGAAVAVRQRAVARELSRISLSQLILLGFLLILGSFFLVRLGGPIAQWLLIAGVVLLVASFGLMLFGGGRGGRGTTRQWRGRTIAYDSDNLARRLRRWFGSRKSR